MANVAPYAVIAGPMDVYFAQTGTAFPACTTATLPGTAWRKIGYTDGGVKMMHPQTVVELKADQTTGPIKAIRSDDGLQVSFGVANLTLANYALALNDAISGPNSAQDPASDNQVALYRGGSQVETISLLLRNEHLSVTGDFPLQIQIPVAFEAGNPEADFTKDNKAVLSLSFHAMVDPSRVNDSASFGYLVSGVA